MADDTSELRDTLQLAINQRQPVKLAARTFNLTRRINLTGGPLIVEGTPGLTILSWGTSPNAGIRVETTGDHQVPVKLTGLSMLTGHLSDQIALSVDYSHTEFPTTCEPWGIFRELTIKGDASPFASGWAMGVHIHNGNRIVMSDCAVSGGIIRSEPNYHSSGYLFTRSRPSAGLYLDHIEAQWCADGLHVKDYEGLIVTRGAFVGVMRGIYVPHGNTFPHVSVSNTHVNAFSECIRIENAHQVLLQNNPLHLQASPNPWPAGIRIIGPNPAKDSVISGNTLQNYGGVTSNQPLGIVIESMDGGVITSNTMAGFYIPLWLTAGAKRVQFGYTSYRDCVRGVINHSTE
jgi:hypothetical protein